VASPVADLDPGPVIALVDGAMSDYHLKAAIARVVIDGQELVTIARGETINGVSATPEMHFRNGAVAISYMSTALLILVDQGVVGLDEVLATWLPDLPDASKTTLRMLANMTAGYPDYVNTDQFPAEAYANPFRRWTPEDLIAISLAQGRTFAPGENWAYSHTDYVILGLALEQIAGAPLDVLLRELVLDPLRLVNTTSFATPEIPEPVLHAFTSERRAALGIPAGTRFYEESTFWDPSWTIARGAIQTTTIADMTASAAAIGEGTLLSTDSHRAQTEKKLTGFGSAMPGCATCRTMTSEVSYGLGIWLVRDWLLQNPSFGGYGAFMAYLPARKIAIAVSVTVDEDGFDDQGNFLTSNASQPIGSAIGSLLAPESPIGA
jgi:CubicO group peptidase (beta-lactamase class C family)